MSKRLQDLPQIFTPSNEDWCLIKQDNGATELDYKITYKNLTNNFLKTSDVGTGVGQIPALESGTGAAALPRLSGENLINLATAVGTANSSTFGVVKLSDSVTSNLGASSGRAATPLAVKTLQDTKFNKSGGTITGLITAENDLQVKGIIYAGATRTSYDQVLRNDGTTIFLGNTSKHLKTHKDLKTVSNETYWHSGNDGTGSGLDADSLDGLHSTSFGRTDEDSTIQSRWTFQDLVYISSDTHSKLNLKNTSSSTQWNYMSFFGSDGTRDAIFGTDVSGSPVWARDGGANISLTSTAGTAHINSSLIITQDNSGTYSDAAKLGGVAASNYARNDSREVIQKSWTFQDRVIVNTTTPLLLLQSTTGENETLAAWVSFRDRTDTERGFVGFGSSANTHLYLNNSLGAVSINGTSLLFNGNTVWHRGNDGAGSGLDADLLDGLQGSSYGKLSVANSWTAKQSFTGLTDSVTNFGRESTPYATIPSGGWGQVLGFSTMVHGNSVGRPTNSGVGYWNVLGKRDISGGYSGLYLPFSGGDLWVGRASNGTDNPNWYRVWTSGSDGAGSGLDADLLDGKEGSEYANAVHSHTGIDGGAIGDLNIYPKEGELTHSRFSSNAANRPPNVTNNANSVISFGMHSGNYTGQIAMNYAGDLYTRRSGGSTFTSWSQLWSSSNDGAGSGLDADLLDGLQGSSYGKLSTTNSWTNVNRFTTLKIGSTENGRFYSDSTGRTCFADGSMYFQTTMPIFYNYATTTYHGASSGCAQLFRGNNLTGNNWSLDSAGSLQLSGVLHADAGLSQDGHVVLNGSDTWLRTKGTTGWYSTDYETGIYCTAAKVVRVYNSGALQVDNGSINAIRVKGGIQLGGTTSYGRGVTGLYSAVRFQGVFAMGAAYQLSEDGSSPSNLYGIAWTHSNNTNTNGRKISGHHAVFMTNGVTGSAIGDHIWTKGTVYEGGVALSSKYLGKTATASNSSKLANRRLSDSVVNSTVVGRDSSGNISARLFRATYSNQSTISGAIAFRVNNSSDNYTRYCSSKSAIRTWLNTYSKAEVDAKLGNNWTRIRNGSEASSFTASQSLAGKECVFVSSDTSSTDQISVVKVLIPVQSGFASDVNFYIANGDSTIEYDYATRQVRTNGDYGNRQLWIRTPSSNDYPAIGTITP